MNYVCPEHQDVVLFSDERDSKRTKRNNDAAFGAILTEVNRPRLCPRCNIYYLKHECKIVAEVVHEAKR